MKTRSLEVHNLSGTGEVSRFALRFMSALFVFAATPALAGKACPDIGNKKSEFNLAEGLDGVFFRTNTDFEEFFVRTSETMASLRAISDALRVKGTELVFLPLPSRGIVQRAKLDDRDELQARYNAPVAEQEFRHYVAQLQKNGITTVDVLKAIDDHQARGNFFFARDHHWTSSGAHLVASAAAETIKKLAGYPSLSTYNFETKAVGSLDYIAPMGHEIQALCGSAVEPEKETLWQTTRSADDASDLLGNATETSSPVALVGSSFSATPEFNFAGFLAQETGLDITNYAENGAQFISSLATLVFSKGFHEKPAPLIVWEAPSYYAVDQTMFQASRQLLAAVYGSCEGKGSIANSQPKKIDGETVLLSAAGLKGEPYGDAYLEFAASQAGLNQMTVTVRYRDGDEDTLTLGGFPRFVDDGTFYLMLNDEFPTPITGVSVNGNFGDTTVTARLCRVPDQFIKKQG
ncbi:alginate O-acetyltransferase [Agrobacterium tumefaciens]|uniref:AlgX/AlgJ SGNH hydrolase-like domain-containing protein n=1 Tax=Agrobacterium tumefaciens TaxID=358 RepID=A0A4D7YG96_AGRTU|nr:alginate O-acetyltransferase [Agrobacterium tumefaciens]QCL95535.1 hypothetical protein CFBP7129_14640 [Agrobacterium tumefaciens]